MSDGHHERDGHQPHKDEHGAAWAWVASRPCAARSSACTMRNTLRRRAVASTSANVATPMRDDVVGWWRDRPTLAMALAARPPIPAARASLTGIVVLSVGAEAQPDDEHERIRHEEEEHAERHRSRQHAAARPRRRARRRGTPHRSPASAVVAIPDPPEHSAPGRARRCCWARNRAILRLGVGIARR